MGGKGGGGGGGGKGGADWLCPMASCAYRNFAFRSRCRLCDALPEGQAAARLKGKGKGPRNEADARAQEVGGIAGRQLHQQRLHDAAARRDRALELEKAEHKRTTERLQRVQRQLEAARKAGGTAEADPEADDDLDDEDAEEDGADDKREQELVAEIKAVEDCLRSLAESSPLRDPAVKRAAEAKAELQTIREKRGGPEAKVLGLAGRHTKLLRSTRAKLLRKRRAQERLEGELLEMDAEREAFDKKYAEKKKELQEARDQAKTAHDELERLSQTVDATPADAAASSAGGDSDTAKAKALARQLVAVLPAEWQPHLGQLLKTVVDQTNAAEIPPKPPNTPAPTDQKRDGGDGDEKMEDLDATTVELLDNLGAFLDAAADEEEHAGSGAGTGNGAEAKSETRTGGSRSLAGALRGKGAAAEKYRRVVKDLKSKHVLQIKLAEKAAAAAAARASTTTDDAAAPAETDL